MLEIARVQDANYVGSQAQWSTAVFCICLQHFGRSWWRRWTLKMCDFTVEATFYVLLRIICYSVGTQCSEKNRVVLTHLNPVCWRTLSIFIKFLCQSHIDDLLDGVLWYYAWKLHCVWSCVPVWMKHATHSLLLGFSILSFALMKIINKFTNK